MAGLYVALGDSMSIDDYAGGAGRGAASLLYRIRDLDFPDWAGRDLAAAGFSPLLLARDGATASDVLDHQLPQLSASPDLVTITMGGNDLLTLYRARTRRTGCELGLLPDYCMIGSWWFACCI